LRTTNQQTTKKCVAFLARQSAPASVPNMQSTDSSADGKSGCYKTPALFSIATHVGGTLGKAQKCIWVLM